MDKVLGAEGYAEPRYDTYLNTRIMIRYIKYRREKKQNMNVQESYLLTISGLNANDF